ncbi:MAG: hypothetical protein IJW63_09310 [Lachnospiraceae bacterium]|nr:hypothetical protein [Lachnospiraceae bacterium]
MSQQKQVKSSSIFLLELILAILFFSVASAVCVQIFVKAHTMSESSQALNFAVSECSGIAEILTTADDLEEIKKRLEILYPMALQTTFPEVALYYDGNFESCTQSQASFQLAFTLQDISQDVSSNADPFRTIEAQISFENLTTHEQIYALDIKHHFPQEVQR